MVIASCCPLELNKSIIKSDISYSTIVVLFTILMPVFTVFVIPKLYTTQELASYSNYLFYVQVAAAVASFGINTILRRDFYRGLIVEDNLVAHHALIVSFPILIIVATITMVVHDIEVVFGVIGYYFIGIFINYLRVSNSFKLLTIIEVFVNNLIPITAMTLSPMFVCSRFQIYVLLVTMISVFIIVRIFRKFELHTVALKNYLNRENLNRIIHNFGHILITQVNKRGEYFIIGLVLSLKDFSDFNYAYLFLNFIVIVFARAILVLEKYLLKVKIYYLLIGLFVYLGFASLLILFVLPLLVEYINVDYLGYVDFVRLLLIHTVSILIVDLFSTRHLLLAKEKVITFLMLIKSSVLIFSGGLLMYHYFSINEFYTTLVIANILIALYFIYDSKKFLSEEFHKTNR